MRRVLIPILIILIVAIGLLFFFTKSPFPHKTNDTAKTLPQKRVLGIYTGTLPCADCSGLKTTLTLYTNSTYHLSEIYLGKSDKPFEQDGSFSIVKGTTDNPSALIYAIDTGSKDNPWYFLRVDNNHLTALDAEKKIINAPGMNFTLTRDASASAQ